MGGTELSATLVSRSLSLRIAIAFALACLSSTQPAEASPSSKLVYIRGAGADACPGEDDLRKAVAARLGYDPFFPSAQKTVVAEVTRTPGGYRAKVQIVGDARALGGARELATKGDDCAELVSTMGLAISIALDDLDAEERAQAETQAPKSEQAAPPPETSPPAEAIPPPAAPLLLRRRPTEKTHADLSASLGPTLSFGTAPVPAVGGGVAVTLGYGPLAARASFRAEFAASDSFAPAGTVSAQTLMGTLEGCVRAKIPFACAGAGYGSIATETSGIPRAASDHGRLVTVLATVGARVPLAGIYIEPFVSGGLNLVEERVEVDRRRVYTVPLVVGVGGIHVGWQFL